MTISDKNRKILWAKSGNRCAICRQKLVIDETELDSESVIGEECHICAQSPTGPRCGDSIPKENIDDIDNIILLCSIHHKMIDDQSETYTISLLKEIKKNHETWIEDKFKDNDTIKPIRIRRIKNNIPDKLLVIISGKELMALASNCMATYHDYSDNLTTDEINIVGGFLQSIRDYMDIWDDIELFDQVQISMEISKNIKELDEKGFLVFAGIETQKLEGGKEIPSNFNALHLSIIRKNDKNIKYSHKKKDSA